MKKNFRTLARASLPAACILAMSLAFFSRTIPVLAAETEHSEHESAADFQKESELPEQAANTPLDHPEQAADTSQKTERDTSIPQNHSGQDTTVPQEQLGHTPITVAA